ncbi:hypothetical protein Mgra_00008049 [Meloidogyne graminicola]|uniref:Negative elongation factor D n=1 Tax=Meloidogyne graminicola TaxID=189291 RepID=A0A8S9ZGU1_9BILA|nr:hypothetical protein Mgra_00008049 [Meloidogyne graminicola]
MEVVTDEIIDLNKNNNSVENDNNQLDDEELIKGHCIELFSSRDFVMEPQVINTLLAFFQAGGQPEKVIELLSNNYDGLGQYANLLGCWLADLEIDEGFNLNNNNILNDIEINSSSSCIVNKQQIEKCSSVRNCFEQTISQMIKKQFSPDEADKIFESDDGTEGIDWLPELISHSSWRKLIYELAEHFPNCLMLNFAVKLISDAGFQHEISNVNTATQQLDIFSRVFLSTLEQLIDEWKNCLGDCQVNAYQQHFAELKRVACHSEQTFMYTQMLLNYFGWKCKDKKQAEICSSLAQQLRLSFEGKIEDIEGVHIGIIQSCIDNIPLHIIQAMQTMFAKGLNPADITQLYQAYSSQNPPPVVLIRDPFFTEMLIDGLFSATNAKIHKEHRSKYIFLLSYSCSVIETINEGNQQPKRKNIFLLKQDNSELNSTCEKMQRLVDILYSYEDLLLSLDQLLELIKLPVLSASILHYLRTFLIREDGVLTEPISLHYVLIDQIAEKHFNLHERVFKLLCDLYDNLSARNEVAEIIMERQRQIVDRFVNLLYSGMAIPVLEKIVSMFKSGYIDVSLVRYFGIEVLELVDQPYTCQFTSALLPIVTNKEVIFS